MKKKLNGALEPFIFVHFWGFHRKLYLLGLVKPVHSDDRIPATFKPK